MTRSRHPPGCSECVRTCDDRSRAASADVVADVGRHTLCSVVVPVGPDSLRDCPHIAGARATPSARARMTPRHRARPCGLSSTGAAAIGSRDALMNLRRWIRISEPYWPRRLSCACSCTQRCSCGVSIFTSSSITWATPCGTPSSRSQSSRTAGHIRAAIVRAVRVGRRRLPVDDQLRLVGDENAGRCSSQIRRSSSMCSGC